MTTAISHRCCFCGDHVAYLNSYWFCEDKENHIKSHEHMESCEPNFCNGCGGALHPDRKDQKMCESCRGNLICKECGCSISVHLMRNAPEEVKGLCIKCAKKKKGVGMCKKCGRFGLDARLNREGVCHSCEMSTKRGKKLINSSNPPIRFYSGKGRHNKVGVFAYGWELEVDFIKGSRTDLAEEVLSLPKIGDRMWAKTDGSLTRGIEFCSHPHTYNGFVKADFNPMFDVLRGKCTSHDAGTCGLHVHISRDKMNEELEYRLLAFFEENWVYIKKFSRRNDQQMTWCHRKFKSTDTERWKDRKIVKSTKGTGRGALNFGNRKGTVEVRIFRGTLIPETFKASIEFCDSLLMFLKRRIKDRSPMDKKWSDYCAYCKRRSVKYPNIVKYMKVRKVFAEKEK